MRCTRVLVAAAAAVLLPTTALAASDYPPNGAVVVVSGELVVGETVDVTVHNCSVGEEVRTSLEGSGAVMSVCHRAFEAFSEPAGSPSRRPGLSQYRLVLPFEPGVVAGTVELLGSDETLSFFLDVRARPAEPAIEAPTVSAPAVTVATTELTATTGEYPGWPFLVLALAIMVVVFALVTRDRRRPETP